MARFGTFALGFAAGWMVRATVDSSRSATVAAMAAAMAGVDRLRRFVAIERDNLKDLVAEARARAEDLRKVRARARRGPRPVPRAAE
jgi:hypothetical protein